MKFTFNRLDSLSIDTSCTLMHKVFITLSMLENASFSIFLQSLSYSGQSFISEYKVFLKCAWNIFIYKTMEKSHSGLLIFYFNHHYVQILQNMLQIIFPSILDQYGKVTTAM